MARLFIAAAHKSSGKTTFTIGLAAALQAQGLRTQPFKKGPDYIDPMWLSRAARRPCYNLDFNTMRVDEINATYAQHGADADICLIEANKGLYDGLDPEGADSNAALAKQLRAPVILVIDCEGMTRGIAPLVLGYVGFDPDIAIKGVILNNVGGPRHEGKLRAALERYTDVPVLGAVARNKDIVISERHLGLTPPDEIAVLDEKIARIRDVVSAGVDIDRLKQIAAEAPVLRAAPGEQLVPVANPVASTKSSEQVRIGVARDAAFGFYYPDDLLALEAAGAQLVLFDTMASEHLPGNLDGLFIGGGFPETHMTQLAQNAALRADIKRAVEAGMPTYAECGGLMYLARSLTWGQTRCEMAGVIPGDAVMHERPQGRGYVHLRETSVMPWSVGNAGHEDGFSKSGANSARLVLGREFRAHEFHYASLDNLRDDMIFAYDVRRGHGIDGAHDGIVMYNMLANFSHLRDSHANRWAARFVDFVQAKRRNVST